MSTAATPAPVQPIAAAMPVPTATLPINSSIPVLPSLKNLSAMAAQAPVASAQATTELKDEKTAIDLPSKKITESDVVALTRRYASDKKAQDRMLEYVLFGGSVPSLEGNKIIFPLESSVSEQQLDTYKSAYIDFLREHLGQNFVVEARVIEARQEKKLLYSPTDKFKFLVDQYPALEDLKKRLGLELEF